MEIHDKNLRCRECGADFVFTVSEQVFYIERGLQNEPHRCPSCRANRRGQRTQGNREMHPVICAQCGVETTVPFIPRDDRPVYCSSCYETVRAAQRSG